MIIDLFSFNNIEANNFGAGEVGFGEINSRDLVIIVGGVIENTFFEVIA